MQHQLIICNRKCTHLVVNLCSARLKSQLSPKSARTSLKGGLSVEGAQNSCWDVPGNASSRMLSHLRSKCTTSCAATACHCKLLLHIKHFEQEGGGGKGRKGYAVERHNRSFCTQEQRGVESGGGCGGC